MIRFDSDYTEGCIPEILDAIAAHNLLQLQGYSEDPITERTRDKLRTMCSCQDADVHFLVGGTQTNATVIASALRPYQGVISAETGHIACHETGAIEATGHKVIALPTQSGRLSADQISRHCAAHWSNASFEHIPQPAMVYLSHSAENGSIYTLEELTAIRKVCDQWNLLLYVDGARLGYALASPANDISLPDLARLTDVFYLGGTKQGALFGEAVVITNPALKKDFRYMIKRQGGMLAKGWLLGLQFDILLDRYMELSQNAVAQALRIKQAFEQAGCRFYMESWTNQQFPILDNETMHRFDDKYAYTVWEAIDASHTAVRFCTSWATTDAQVDALLADISRILPSSRPAKPHT